MMDTLRDWMTIPLWMWRFTLDKCKRLKFWQYLLLRMLGFVLTPVWAPLMLVALCFLAPIGWTIEWYEEVRRDFNNRSKNETT